MSDQAIAVFTAKSKERIFQAGGSQSWVLNRAHARKLPYVVCVRNANHADTDGHEPHGTAFLVGRIKDIIPSSEIDKGDGETGNRWNITISEYAEIDIPNAWQGWRNPVRYTTLQELGIDPAKLDFKPMPSMPTTRDRSDRFTWNPGDLVMVDPPDEEKPRTRALTIQEAKEGLAETFGVSPEAIEIIIRG
jgi:hypothetical protein